MINMGNNNLQEGRFHLCKPGLGIKNNENIDESG
jgi:hypothetical protein